MLIWMRHPNHGRMDVYSQGEVDLAITRGWYVEESPAAEKSAAKVGSESEDWRGSQGDSAAASVIKSVAQVDTVASAQTPEDIERAQLYAIADQRGIRVDRRWGLERLRKTVGG